MASPSGHSAQSPRSPHSPLVSSDIVMTRAGAGAEDADGASASASELEGNAEHGKALTRRQREKAPVSVDDVALPASADHEITMLISEYLTTRHPRLADALASEVGPARDEAVRQDIESVEKAILDGNFGALESLLATPGLLGPQTQKAFLYMCYRQQFLEYIDNRESQKAFNLLQKRLKPLEHYQPVPYDFYSLAYLTSASTVHDAPGLRDWAGAGPEREHLVAMWRELTDTARLNVDALAGGAPRRPVPRDRLMTLLRQATAWQVEAARPRGPGPYPIQSLLTDYSSPSVPSRLERLVRGHRANVKCVTFLRDNLGVSGSSDTTLRIFNTETGDTQHVLTGHQSRVWDVATSPETGSYIASASGDGTVRIWTASNGECASVLVGDGGDVYSVRWQPGREDRVVAACYDKILRLWDVATDRLIRTFSGHAQSTLAVCFDPTGKVIASGSKDKHVRLWDSVGGVCVQTMTAHLGEITSVQFDNDGKYLLAGCKDNSIRLWDLRMQRNIYRYTGHQNTSKNIIRAAFITPSSSLIASGSEDGLVYLWEREGSEAGAVNELSPPPLPTLSAMTASPTLGGSPGYFSAHPHIGSTGVGSSHVHPARAPTLPRGPSTHLNMVSYPSNAFPDRDRSGAPVPPRWAGGTTPIVPGAPTVRPFKALAGHGPGAVFDVCAEGGILLSAGEDGAVGVWGSD